MDSTDDTQWGDDRTLAAGPQSEPAAPIGPGTRIGRYVILDRIGAGAMGVVLAAHDPKLDRKVAIKLLKGAHEEDATERLTREALALAKLSHENVVGVHDVGVHGGQVFVAMEFIDGVTLKAWLAERTRPWREVLPAFESAGRGLAAAHRAGLVHRDFKPENVMVDRRGRVRVMDFGLARAATGGNESGGGDESGAAPHEAGLEQRTKEQAVAASSVSTGEFETSRSFEVELTRTGAILGTPAYMAPELFHGAPGSARSDQFAFGVALFEGLYATRPFRGDSMAALVFSISEGNLAETTNRNIPVWLRNVVRRALHALPEQRHADMDQLLEALNAGEARRRRVWRLGIVAAGLGGVGLLWGGAHFSEQRAITQCAEQAEQSTQWDDSTRQEVRQGLASVGTPYAEQTAEEVVTRLDAQALALREATEATCLDTDVREDWDEQRKSRAEWCLDERRWQLESLAAAFTQADGETLRRAAAISDDLLDVHACRDAEALDRLPELPADRDALARIRRELSRASALYDTAQYEEGLGLAQSVLERAETFDWAPLTAAARTQLGAFQDALGEYAEAKETLHAAYFEAMRAGAHRTAFEAANLLVLVHGAGLRKQEEGLAWADHADLAVDLLGEDPNGPLGGKVDQRRAVVHETMGQFDQASQLNERAITILSDHLGDHHPEVARVRLLHATVLSQLGQATLATETFESALADLRKARSGTHPDVGVAEGNFGNHLLSLGEFDKARDHLALSVTIFERSLGEDHPQVAKALIGLGNIAVRVRDHDAALAAYERALEISEGQRDEAQPLLPIILTNYGMALDLSGDAERAREVTERALNLKRASLREKHPSLATTLVQLAFLDRKLGDVDLAYARNSEALEIWESELGPSHPRLAYALDPLARIELEDRDAPQIAVAFAERAVALRSAEGISDADRAASEFLLARALWDAPQNEGRDRPRAHRLATAAAAVIDEQTKPELHEKIQTWLATHGSP